jgi:hypothetical protein
MSERERQLLDLLARAGEALEAFCGDELDAKDGGCPCADCKRGKAVLSDLYEVLLEAEENE